MDLKEFKKITENFKKSNRMPMLFVGHGNPMNAIEQNSFSENWKMVGKYLPKPEAILSISAHWLTNGTRVTAAENPKTIHDFFGFPEKLFQQLYPAPGTLNFAMQTQTMALKHHIILDDEWGFDHGTWSVLLQMFPEANIPVYQLSINYNQQMHYHYELARELTSLREKGVLVLGSGNIVHNLHAISFQENNPYDWALEFDSIIAQLLEKGDYEAIIEFQKLGHLSHLAHPTYDHFLPLLYTLGFQTKDDSIKFFNEEFDMCSVSMRSVIFG